MTIISDSSVDKKHFLTLLQSNCDCCSLEQRGHIKILFIGNQAKENLFVFFLIDWCNSILKFFISHPQKTESKQKKPKVKDMLPFTVSCQKCNKDCVTDELRPLTLALACISLLDFLQDDPAPEE